MQPARAMGGEKHTEIVVRDTLPSMGGAVCVILSVSKSSTTKGESSAFTGRQSLRLEWSLLLLTRMKRRKRRQVFYETNETKILLINVLLQISAHLEEVLDRLADPQWFPLSSPRDRLSLAETLWDGRHAIASTEQ